MKQYATHLSDEDIAELANATESMSGRDLRDIAEQTERRTASKASASHLLYCTPASVLPRYRHCASGLQGLLRRHYSLATWGTLSN